MVRAPKNCGPRGVWTAWTACPAGGTSLGLSERYGHVIDRIHSSTYWILKATAVEHQKSTEPHHLPRYVVDAAYN